MTDNVWSGWKVFAGCLYIAMIVVMWNTLIVFCDFGFVGVPTDEFGRDLSNFPTRQALVNFLSIDTTNENPFTEDYDCTGYALDLKKNARSSGYRVRVYAIIGDRQLAEYNTLLEQHFRTSLDMGSGGPGHALCKAYIVDEGLWVTIEPQGDLILNCTIGGGW